MEQLLFILKVLEDFVLEVGIEVYDSYSIVVAVWLYVVLDDFWEVKFEVYCWIKVVFYSYNISVVYFEGVEMGKIGF